jgi:NADH:ubiquinone oxidoreductase subunit F (NADH-binding)
MLRQHLDQYGQLPPGGRGGRRRGGLIEAVTTAGLTGRGGAGFPTGTKMRAVALRRGPAVVVANGMEGEPASEKDHALLSRAPHLALDGAVLAAEAIGADVAHLCLPQTSEWLTELMLVAIEERQDARLDRVRIELHVLPDHYVAGEETSLVRWLNGGEAKPLATPPRPFEKGVLNRPTLVDNVETLAHVALIARYGPGWFRQAGLPDAPGTMLTTVSGAVEAPGVYEIELGTLIGDVLSMSGVGNEVSAVLIGGYFGTWHDLRAVAGLPFSAAGLQHAGASPGTGVLFALPPDACGLAETARVLEYLADQSAGQCGPCTFGLPAIAADFAQIASGQPQGPVLDRLERRLGTVTGRGACRHPDGATRMAGSALGAFAADARDHVSRWPCAASRHTRAPALPVPRPWAEEEWR